MDRTLETLLEIEQNDVILDEKQGSRTPAQ